MTRMTRRFFPYVSSCLLVFSLMTVGCGPSKKDLAIQDLTAENDQLKNDLDDRDRQISDALVRENEARDTIDELNKKMVSIEADSKTPKNADGWVTMPSFDMISVPGSVLFASGKASLSRPGRRTLAKIASDIRARFPDRDIYVFGHTDNEPIRKSKWKDNWELGAVRSLNVVRALRDLGISNQNLVQANCGEFRPKSGNTGSKSRARNRRVEFYAVKPDSGIIGSRSARGFGED